MPSSSTELESHSSLGRSSLPHAPVHETHSSGSHSSLHRSSLFTTTETEAAAVALPYSYGSNPPPDSPASVNASLAMMATMMARIEQLEKGAKDKERAFADERIAWALHIEGEKQARAKHDEKAKLTSITDTLKRMMAAKKEKVKEDIVSPMLTAIRGASSKVNPDIQAHRQAGIKKEKSSTMSVASRNYVGDNDEEEMRVRKQEAKSAQRELIFESEEEGEDELSNYVMWLQKRERVYPFTKHPAFYGRRYTLLSHEGRWCEFLRTGTQLGFPTVLFGKGAHRWYKYMKQQGLGVNQGEKEMRKVLPQVVSFPTMVFDDEDPRLNVPSAASPDLVPNSRTLASLPLALQVDPPASQSRECHRMSLTVYVAQFIRQFARRRMLTTAHVPVPGGNASADGTSSPSEEELSSSPPRHSVGKSRVSDDPHSLFSESTQPPPLEDDSADLEIMAKSNAIERVKREQTARLKKEGEAEKFTLGEYMFSTQARKEREKQVERMSSSDLRDSNDSVLGDVIGTVLDEAMMATFRAARPLGMKAPTLGRDRKAILDTVVTTVGPFKGESKTAPTWLLSFCREVYINALAVADCHVVLSRCMKERAAKWYTSNMGEITSTFPPEYTIQALLHRFKEHYMGRDLVRRYRDRLTTLKMTGAPTIDGLGNLYTQFHKYANNLRLCDKTVTSQSLREDFVETLPMQVRSYIGLSWKNMKSVDEIYRAAEEAVTTLDRMRRVTRDGDLRPRVEMHAMVSDEAVLAVTDLRFSPTRSFPIRSSPTRPDRRRGTGGPVGGPTGAQIVPSGLATAEDHNQRYAICYHCGDRGHRTGKCRLNGGPQTLAGKHLWAARNRHLGNDWPYDVEFYKRQEEVFAAQGFDPTERLPRMTSEQNRQARAGGRSNATLSSPVPSPARSGAKGRSEREKARSKAEIVSSGTSGSDSNS